MTHLTCLACGYQGPEVHMALVRVPAEEQRIVDNPYAVSHDIRDLGQRAALPRLQPRRVPRREGPPTAGLRERLPRADPGDEPTAGPASRCTTEGGALVDAPMTSEHGER